MKPRITTLLVLFSCSLAFADVAVNFSAQSSPILKAGSSELVSENALDDDVLVQLIWSQTATGYQTDGLDLSLVNPDEFILETNTNNQFGTFSPAMVSVFTDADVGGADINAGYIYARIFDSAVPTAKFEKENSLKRRKVKSICATDPPITQPTNSKEPSGISISNP